MTEREELLPFFDMVKDEANWKNPIAKTFNQSCDQGLRDKISRAIQFFTGTQATWTFTPNTSRNGGSCKVEADGYYLGPCN